MEIEKNIDPAAAQLQGQNAPQQVKDKVYRVFCEKHRPLKIVKEMEERDVTIIDEIQRFCKILDRCMEIDLRSQLKSNSHRLEKKKEKEKREREKERERERARMAEIKEKMQAKENLIKLRE